MSKKTEQFKISAEKILENYNTFIKSIKKLFPERSDALMEMYNAFGKDRIMFAPASSSEHFHNCFPGGYVDHVLRVMKYSSEEYEHMKKIGVDVSNFTLKELLFAALNHDLGKLGYPGEGNESYQPNPSDWHRKNLGQLYVTNEDTPFVLTQDLSLFTLQSFRVPCTLNEYLAIRAHDGMYDDANVPYFKSYKLKSKPRTYMTQILHNADMNASRFEFERWAKHTNKFKMSRSNDLDNIFKNQLNVIKSQYATLEESTGTHDIEKEFEEKFEG